MARTLKGLEREITGCERCARLRAWCQRVALEKRAMYREETYWGKPVAGFGDEGARLFVLGLAPGAHGANRTGRVFTGDRSGDWLYRALHEAGFANRAESVRRGDGLELKECWVSASVRCAPPENKPLPGEVEACRPYLREELRLLGGVRVIVALGRLAWENLLEVYGLAPKAAYRFAHLAEISGAPPSRPVLLASYHPSQQNTQTGRLTREMLRAVFERARALLDSAP